MVRGIDVSTHNGALDWEKIRDAGFRFAIVRAGYGRFAVDDQFHANIRGAAAQGIPAGVYWFSYAVSEDAARQEAEKCLETIRGYDLTLPVFYDFEYDSVRYAQQQGVTVGREQYNRFARAFLEEIRAAGYTPGIYYNLQALLRIRFIYQRYIFHRLQAVIHKIHSTILPNIGQFHGNARYRQFYPLACPLCIKVQQTIYIFQIKRNIFMAGKIHFFRLNIPAHRTLPMHGTVTPNLAFGIQLPMIIGAQ